MEMSETLRIVVLLMGVMRVLLGLAPFIAAGWSSRLLGFPVEQDSPTARLMARFFGVRDIGLGVLVFYGLAHTATLPFIFLFNACMDAGDLFSIAIPLVKRQGIDRAAKASSVFALGGGLSWVAVFFIAR